MWVKSVITSKHSIHVQCFFFFCINSLIFSYQELELVEDPMCVCVFPRFLKFLYSCQIKLNLENSLPVLVLADKYNIVDLRNVCISFASSYIIPKLQLKDVFYVWFQYATKCYHRRLIQSCIKAMAEKMDDIIGTIFIFSFKGPRGDMYSESVQVSPYHTGNF